MALENPPRRKKHDVTPSDDEVPKSAIQPPAMQTRRVDPRRRLSFPESRPVSETIQQKAAKKNTPRKSKKNEAADRLDDSGISSTANSPTSHKRYSQYGWRQASPDLTCSSDSDASLKELPWLTASLKNRRSAVGKKRGFKAGGDAVDTTPLRGGKRTKTESVVLKKPPRGPGKRKQENTTEISESPAHKVTRQASSCRGLQSRSLEKAKKEQDAFQLYMANEMPLDGCAWGEIADDRIQRKQQLQQEAKRRANNKFLSKLKSDDDDEGSQDKISAFSELDLGMDGLLL